MSKHLPAEILDDPSFEERLKGILNGYSGIYPLYSRNKLYYVGLTKNLHGRVHSHSGDRIAGRWDSFVVFRIKQVKYLKDIETLLTRVSDPPGNRSMGNVPRDANINRVLRQIHASRKRALRRIEKALR